MEIDVLGMVYDRDAEHVATFVEIARGLGLANREDGVCARQRFQIDGAEAALLGDADPSWTCASRSIRLPSRASRMRQSHVRSRMMPIWVPIP